jgi:hypothetical protein
MLKTGKIIGGTGTQWAEFMKAVEISEKYEALEQQNSGKKLSKRV